MKPWDPVFELIGAKGELLSICTQEAEPRIVECVSGVVVRGDYVHPMPCRATLRSFGWITFVGPIRSLCPYTEYDDQDEWALYAGLATRQERAANRGDRFDVLAVWPDRTVRQTLQIRSVSWEYDWGDPGPVECTYDCVVVEQQCPVSEF